MEQSQSVTLAACGDIMLYGRYDKIAGEKGVGFVFSDIRRLCERCDALVGNMETVLAHGGTARDDKLCLRGVPAYAEALAEVGFNVLSLANNHIFDFGLEGWRETRQHLSEKGVATLGAGEDLEQAVRPVIVERNGLRLGFLAYCHDSTKPSNTAEPGRAGVAPLRGDDILPRLRQLKERVDHVVLLCHWGLEYSHYPTPEQVGLGRKAIDHGASVVLGHHSHALQGIEEYRNGIIAYSLGNFTDAPVHWEGPKKTYEADLSEVDRESVMLLLGFDRESVRLSEVIPLWLGEDGRPGVAEKDRAQKIRHQLEEYSWKLKAEKLERFWEAQVIETRVAGPFMSWWKSGSLLEKVGRFRPSQFITLYLLARTYLKVRFSRSESKWLLFNARNDTRPMPSVHREEQRHR